jgi:hypothetical protein
LIGDHLAGSREVGESGGSVDFFGEADSHGI